MNDLARADWRQEPVAVSGVGLASAAGAGVDAFWGAFRRQESHLAALRQIPVEGLAMARGGEVPDAVLDTERVGFAGDRALRMAAVAAREALGDAGLDAARSFPRERIGLVLGTALGAVQTLEALHEDGRLDDTERWLQVAPERTTRSLAERLDLRGPRWTFSVTCASGLYGLEQALADLRLRRADAVVCGGLDTLSRFMQTGFCSLRALSPSGRLRPFDPDHDGIVLGEGAAFVVLERLASVRERGGRAHGVVAANRLLSDASHLTSPDASGRGMARAISLAMEDSGLRESSIGCVTPTATGSPVYDVMQSRAVVAALAARGRSVPVTTWEPVVGHALASTGVLGLVHAAQVLDCGEILPTFGLDGLDTGCELNYLLDSATPFRGEAVLALTVGFGGQNGASILKRAAES